jgi:hypothetical protein
MPCRQPVRAVVALTLLSAAGVVAAQSCGQAVTGTVRLTADLYCSGPGPAFTLSGSAARLELAGFRIDMGGSGANAIDIHHAQNAQVTGPGVISSAGIAVSVFRSTDVDLWDFEVENSNAGVFALDSARVAVSNSRFSKIKDQAVFIGSTPGGTLHTAGAVVMGNLIKDVGSGIHLCGQGTTDARVRHNTIRRANGWGIFLYDGASFAQVHRNDVQVSAFQPAIEVRSGSENAIHDNVLAGSRLGSGVAIGSLTGQTCAVNANTAANHNVVSRNTVKGFVHGTRIGLRNGGMAHFNNVQGNLYDGNGVDVMLERDSYATDARGNDGGTRGVGGVAVRDAGTLSLY